MSGDTRGFSGNFRTNRLARKFHNSDAPKPRKGHFASKPLTHGGSSAALSWMGVGFFIIGIVLSSISMNPITFWALGFIAVQMWIASAVVRPIEAIFTLLKEKLQ